MNQIQNLPPSYEIVVETNQNSSKIVSDIAIKFTYKFLLDKRCGVLPYGVNDFVSYPFWVNEVACWSDLNSSQWASWNRK